MSAIEIEITDGGVRIESETDYTVRDIEYERTHQTARAKVSFDTRVIPETVDRFVGQDGHSFQVNDQEAQDVIGVFNTEAEAAAAIVGLEYVLGKQDDRFEVEAV